MGGNCHIVLCTYPVERTKSNDNDVDNNKKNDDDDGDDDDGDDDRSRSSCSSRYSSNSGKRMKSKSVIVLMEWLTWDRNNVRTLITCNIHHCSIATLKTLLRAPAKT